MFAHHVGRRAVGQRDTHTIVVYVRYLNANDVIRQLRSNLEFLAPNIQDISIPTHVNHYRASVPLKS